MNTNALQQRINALVKLQKTKGLDFQQRYDLANLKRLVKLHDLRSKAGLGTAQQIELTMLSTTYLNQRPPGGRAQEGLPDNPSEVRRNRARELFGEGDLFELTTPDNLERADRLQKQYDREDQIIRKGLDGHLQVARRLFPDTDGQVLDR